jgi:NADPH-dependent methylglyoxal reductase
VEDVATIHLTSLDMAKVPGNERYLFHAGVISGNWIANKVRETYPELKDRVPAGGKGDGFPDPMAKFDISRFEQVFGSEWMRWWESANGTVKDILEYEKNGSVA